MCNYKHPIYSISIAIICLLSISSKLRAEKTALVQYCPQSRSNPIIDGKISESEWKDDVAVSGFVYGSDSLLSPVQTLVYAKWSSQSLYLGFVCFEPQMNKLQVHDVGRDGRLWWNDSVEIFIQPNKRLKNYYHFIVDANGRQYDAIGKSACWNGKWKSVTSLEKDKWTIEVEIPFDTINAKPHIGDIWGINYARARLEKDTQGDSWATQWSPSAGNYHRPELFGNLYFANGAGKPTVKELQQIFQKLFSYPGPSVRIFLKEGYCNLTYAGNPEWTPYARTSITMQKQLDNWIRQLRTLQKDTIDIGDKKLIGITIEKWKLGSLLQTDKKQLPVMQWVTRRIVAERVISELYNLYWDIKLKMICKELVK